MADLALETVIDEWGEDADEADGSYYPTKVLECYYCKEPISWLRTRKGWRTSTDGKTVHVCPYFRKGTSQ